MQVDFDDYVLAIRRERRRGSGAQRSPGMRCLSLRRCPPDERR